MSKVINCIIIEDERPAADILELYISKIDLLQLKGTFSSATQGVELPQHPSHRFNIHRH